MPRDRWFVAGAPTAAVVAAALLLAPRPAQAEPPQDERPAAATTVGSTFGPLVDPVGRVAGAGFERVAATTATMIAVATPPAPPLPPAVACPAPEAHFVDTWGAPRSGGRRHEGVDMMAPHGSPVVAPVGGTVRPSNSALGGLGFWLEGDDGNTYFGSHLASLAVSDGRVEPGMPLGTVGSTGNAGGTPHLHFEVMLPGHASVNPYPFAAAWCPAGVR